MIKVYKLGTEYLRSLKADKNSAWFELNRIKDVYSLLSDPDVSYDVKGAAVRSIISDIVVDQTKKEIHFHYYA